MYHSFYCGRENIITKLLIEELNWVKLSITQTKMVTTITFQVIHGCSVSFKMTSASVNCKRYYSDLPVSVLKHQEHDDVIKWKHFPRYCPFVRGIHRLPVNSRHKGRWRGVLMFSLICAWTNASANNREAGDLRRYRAHYDAIVMDWPISCSLWRHCYEQEEE